MHKYLTKHTKHVIYICRLDGIMKNNVSYTEARNNLSNILNQVCDTHIPVIIERR